MAATIASVAMKCNISVLMGGGARLSGRRRFSQPFGSWNHYINSQQNKKNMSLLKLKLKPTTFFDALFCTAQPLDVASTEEDMSKQSQPSIKDSSDLLDIRVGRILKAWRHEEADSLYVEEVDVGEPEPRIICSGLVSHVPLDVLQGLSVVVLANLKPRNMRGVKSSGMLMAASDASHSNVELLVPPDGSLPGQRIWFGDPVLDDQDQPLPHPPPASPNQLQKKKIWELVQPHLKTDGSCVAILEPNHVMRAPAGVVRSTSLKDANIS